MPKPTEAQILTRRAAKRCDSHGTRYRDISRQAWAYAPETLAQYRSTAEDYFAAARLLVSLLPESMKTSALW